MSDALAEIEEHNEAGSTINIPVAGTFVKWTTASAGVSGPSDLVQADAVNNQIVVLVAGIYEIVLSVTLTGNHVSIKRGCVFLNNVAQSKIEFDREIGGVSDIGVTGAHGNLQCVPGDIIDVRFTGNGNGDTVVVRHVVLTVSARVRTP